jgi:hypothetical protein
MGTGAGIPSLCMALAAVTLSVACSHITKLPVTEVPIDQFQATPVGAPSDTPTAPTPVVEPDPTTAAPTTEAPPPSAAAAPKAPAGAASGTAPESIEPADPAEDKIRAATKLMKTGKRADLLAARKLLVADVGSGNGSQGEARLLRTVCTKLGDKPCVAKATSYIK